MVILVFLEKYEAVVTVWFYLIVDQKKTLCLLIAPRWQKSSVDFYVALILLILPVGYLISWKTKTFPRRNQFLSTKLQKGKVKTKCIAPVAVLLNWVVSFHQSLVCVYRNGTLKFQQCRFWVVNYFPLQGWLHKCHRTGAKQLHIWSCLYVYMAKL